MTIYIQVIPYLLTVNFFDSLVHEHAMYIIISFQELMKTRFNASVYNQRTLHYSFRTDYTHRVFTTNKIIRAKTNKMFFPIGTRLRGPKATYRLNALQNQ